MYWAGIQPRTGDEKPEKQVQRSRSNLILKGNPASDWTHHRGSVCISSTCTPSLRVSGRYLWRTEDSVESYKEEEASSSVNASREGDVSISDQTP